jgi:hypothetical protein
MSEEHLMKKKVSVGRDETFTQTNLTLKLATLQYTEHGKCQEQRALQD